MAIKVIIINSIISCTLFIALYFLIQNEKDKVAYIKYESVYAQFKMKQMLESKLTNLQKIRLSEIDSLELDLKLLNKKLQSKQNSSKSDFEQYDNKKQNYFEKKKIYSDQNEQLRQEYTTQIINKLNKYVQDYGKSNNYDYIYGADGSGSIMHAKEVHDITNEVVKYINTCYNGN